MDTLLSLWNKIAFGALATGGLRHTFWKGCVCALFVLLLAGHARGESFTRLLQCDGPSNPAFKEVGALVVQRPENPKRYRLPRIVLNFKNGTRRIYRATIANWWYSPNPLVQSDTVTTFFGGENTNTSLPELPFRFLDFSMRSNGSFQPLSGKISDEVNPPTTFRTCGVQLTSAYYWTRSSMHPNEGFACPTPILGVPDDPPGCPGIGSN
jgi:hypothetical protein